MMEPDVSHALHQASALPFRWRDGELEFCLITSRGTGRWGFPKGTIERGETVEQTALQEAWEEAGLRGNIVGPLGQYSYAKAGRSLTVAVLLMDVAVTLDVWKESNQRRRCWGSASDSLERLCRPDLRRLILSALDQLHPASPPPPISFQSMTHDSKRPSRQRRSAGRAGFAGSGGLRG